MADINQVCWYHGGAVIGDSTNSFHMVVAGGDDSDSSCEIYSFANDSWSSLPDLQSTSYSRRLIVMDEMLVAGGRDRLETLDLSTPELIYGLVLFVVELDLFSSCKKSSCKMDSCATVVKRAKRD